MTRFSWIAFAIVLLTLTSCAPKEELDLTLPAPSTSTSLPKTAAVPTTTATVAIPDPSATATPPMVETWWKVELPAEILFRYGEDTVDGGVLLLGRMRNLDPPTDVLLKLNTDGTLGWFKAFGTALTEIHTLHETSDGRILIAGFTDRDGAPAFTVTLELNADGVLLFQQAYRKFGGPGARILQRAGTTELAPVGLSGRTTVPEEMGKTELELIAPQPDGGAIYVGGSWKTFKLSDGGTHCCEWPGLWIYRVDNRGIVVWQKLYTIDIVGAPLHYLATSDGGIVFAGSQHTGRFAAWIAKINPDGTLQFWKHHAISGYEVYSLSETPDGGFLILARRHALKLDAGGNLVWSRNSPSIGIYDYMYERENGSLLLASSGGFGSHSWVAHISSDGEIPECEDFLSGEGLVAEQLLDPPPDVGASLKVSRYLQEATPDTSKISVIDVPVEARTLCSAPFPTPAPIAQNSPTPAPPRANEVYPILVGRQGLLLGGVRGGTWLDASTAAESVLGGEQYLMYYTYDWPGEAIGAEPTFLQDEVCGPVLSVSLEPRRGGDLTLAVASPWEAFPRTPLELSTDSSTYRGAVHTYLEDHGLEEQRVTFEELWRIDLEGDGVQEVLINASARSSGSSAESSFVLLRKVMGDSVETFSLGEALFNSDHPSRSLAEFSIYAMADLNGDGTIEVVVEGEHENWSELTIFESSADLIAPVLTVDCLPPVP